jgi:hypothetical protein
MKLSMRTRLNKIEQTLDSIIFEVEGIKEWQATLRNYFENYIVMKKDARKFAKFLERRIKEYEREQSKTRETQSPERGGASASSSTNSKAV